MTNFKARPTTYNGVPMRSRLEAGFAQWLDEWNFKWAYEPRAFANASGQYLPDFRLDEVSMQWRSEPATLYVEIKPESWYKEKEPGFEETYLQMTRSMKVIWDSEPDAELALIVPGMNCGFSAAVELLYLDREISEDPEHPDAWGQFAVWVPVGASRSELGLSFPPIRLERGPWPLEFWRVR